MSTGTRLPHGSRLALGLKLLVAIYTVAAMAMPLAHHDVVCHTKTPTHCVTCVVASAGDVAADPTGLARLGLNDLGPAVTDGPCSVACGELRAPSGRAPPFFAL
jgi:hypothetical protein